MLLHQVHPSTNRLGPSICSAAHLPFLFISSFTPELADVKVTFHTDMEDYRRRYNLEPLVKSDLDKELEKGRTRATVDEACPKCTHPQMEFYTMQLRSADEGQTVFYECPNCGHKYSTNT
ncbi:hypothetical protein DUNSADRAFT_7325 [Dunaliella salina]|uniref:DNA-directed RNA polymerase I subunit RPA12 n=1 Tax=Dunaliella salina TaxID=3046 RepID=A0ABQ7GLK4_DUNSA|nr:hypothetical protein DUNSADRAFT_7325 [Dunaliella salina]|eukprot:KAF5835485.1 hypothetical protein DUNSADRAFT_7325 [Dunaliella salina]